MAIHYFKSEREADKSGLHLARQARYNMETGKFEYVYRDIDDPPEEPTIEEFSRKLELAVQSIERDLKLPLEEEYTGVLLKLPEGKKAALEALEKAQAVIDKYRSFVKEELLGKENELHTTELCENQKHQNDAFENDKKPQEEKTW